MTWDDSYIEHWGEFYLERPWLRRLVTFEVFLRDPDFFSGRPPHFNCRCLLPEQRAIQTRLDAARRQT